MVFPAVPVNPRTNTSTPSPTPPNRGNCSLSRGVSSTIRSPTTPLPPFGFPPSPNPSSSSPTPLPPFPRFLQFLQFLRFPRTGVSSRGSARCGTRKYPITPTACSAPPRESPRGSSTPRTGTCCWAGWRTGAWACGTSPRGTGRFRRGRGVWRAARCGWWDWSGRRRPR